MSRLQEIDKELAEMPQFIPSDSYGEGDEMAASYINRKTAELEGEKRGLEAGDKSGD